MMMIIQLEKEPSGFNQFESQSHRTEVWEDGYVSVSENLEDDILSCAGFCELVTENGVLNGIIPIEHVGVIDPDPPSEPTEPEDVSVLLVDHEYRLTLLELGVI